MCSEYDPLYDACEKVNESLTELSEAIDALCELFYYASEFGIESFLTRKGVCLQHSAICYVDSATKARLKHPYTSGFL